MKAKNKKDPIFITFVVLILFTIVIIGAASVISGIEKNRKHDYIDFGMGWVYENGGDADLNVLKESCVLLKTIPELDSDEDLIFNARNINVDVYIDDICLYKAKGSDSPFLNIIFGKSVGSEFVEVEVLKENSGKTLRLNVTNPYNNAKACRIVNMYFGDGGSIMKYNTSMQLGSFCFSVIILFIGAACLALYIPMGRHDMVDRSMLYIGMTAFAFGMLMMTDSKLLHMAVGHGTLYYTASQMFMLIIPVPLLLFFEMQYDDINKKLIRTLCVIDLVDYIAVFVLNAFNVIDYYDNSIIMLLIYVASIAYVGFVTLKRIVLHDKDHIFHNIGVLMIAVSTVPDMILTRVGGAVDTSFFTRIGLVGFIFLECIQVMWKHIENYQRGVKAQLVSRLAYHDGLTDMLNRTSFKEDMEVLEAKEHSEVLIAVFDVNGLKDVNDNFGHACGDELIVSTANSLSKALDGIGKCYRTGGDEFVFISDKPDAENQFLSARDALDACIKEVDAHSKYPVSVASGYAVMHKDCAGLKELLKEADGKMYENKRIMKEQEKKA